MDRTDILELAQQASRSSSSRLLGCGIDDLERFAELVSQRAIAEALVSVSHAVAAEREACAKACEDFDFNKREEIEPPRTLPRYCAAAIRMRSNV